VAAFSGNGLPMSLARFVRISGTCSCVRVVFGEICCSKRHLLRPNRRFPARPAQAQGILHGMNFFVKTKLPKIQDPAAYYLSSKSLNDFSRLTFHRFSESQLLVVLDAVSVIWPVIHLVAVGIDITILPINSRVLCFSGP
jgi:hypothetical protein